MKYLAIWLGFLLMPPHALSQTVVIGSDYWCPYVCSPDEGGGGILVDIWTEALALSGMQFRLEPLPYNRAIRMSETNQIDGVIGLDKSQNAQLAYSDKPFVTLKLAALSSANTNVAYQTPEDLAPYIILVTRGLTYGPDLDRFLATRNDKQLLFLHGLDAAYQATRLIKAGRAHVYFDERRALLYHLKRLDIERHFRIFDLGKTTIPLYFAIAPATHEKWGLADRLARNYQTLVVSGRVDAIYARYGLTMEF